MGTPQEAKKISMFSVHFIGNSTGSK